MHYIILSLQFALQPLLLTHCCHRALLGTLILSRSFSPGSGSLLSSMLLDIGQRLDFGYLANGADEVFHQH